MPLLFPQRAYQALATILRLPGSEGIRGLQDEAVPTQDLQRVLQDARVKQTLYQFAITPAATTTTTIQWNDVSDWTEVIVDGVIQSADDALPQRNETRIIVGASLRIAGTVGEYTRAALYRRTENTTAENILCREWGALGASLLNALPQPDPGLLPQYLQFQENSLRIQSVVSGATADLTYAVEMLSCERGLLSPLQGV